MPKGHDNSLRSLLTSFNEYDKSEKGVVEVDEAE